MSLSAIQKNCKSLVSDIADKYQLRGLQDVSSVYDASKPLTDPEAVIFNANWNDPYTAARFGMVINSSDHTPFRYFSGIVPDLKIDGA